jgi:serine/threonine protein phosphatase 1
VIHSVFKRKASKRSLKRDFSLPEGSRVYAMGDIHGRADLLQRAFDLIDADTRARPSKTRAIITLGDYIDRGPQSSQVLDLLIARKAVDPSLVCLKGNHEQVLLNLLSGHDTYDQWCAFGGRETLMSYGISFVGRTQEEVLLDLRRAMPEAHMGFLRELEIAVGCGDYFFVHAGVRPDVPLNEQSERDLLWIREEFIRSDYLFERRIVHGHTPCKSPEILPNRINIDTGAYITGRLTCLALEGSDVRFVEE